MSENDTVSARSLREQTSEEIRALLARRKMNASDLARTIGATQPYVSRRLTGAVAFDLDDLEKIARVLEVAVTDLLPRPSEGRVISTGGQRGQKDTHYYPPATNGQAKKTIPAPRNSHPPARTDQPSVPPSLRRPARISSSARPATA